MHVTYYSTEMFSEMIVLLEYFDIFMTLIKVVKILCQAKNSVHYA